MWYPTHAELIAAGVTIIQYREKHKKWRAKYEEAKAIRKAVQWTLENGFVTKDIDPINFYFTSTIGELVCDHIAQRIPGEVNKANIEIRKSTII